MESNDEMESVNDMKEDIVSDTHSRVVELQQCFQNGATEEVESHNKRYLAFNQIGALAFTDNSRSDHMRLGGAYAYSVHFTESDLTWAHRLDHYTRTWHKSIHYGQIALSFGVAIALSVFMRKQLAKMLNADFEILKRNMQRLRDHRNDRRA